MPTHTVDSDVLSLFPTFVWKLRWAADLVDTVNAIILAHMDSAIEQWRTLAPGTFWQSDPHLHHDPAMAKFVSAVCGSAQSVLRFLHVADAALDVTGCWINVNSRGAAHGLHVHPNNYLSGVYYVQTPPGAETINFHDPRPQTSVLRPPVTQLVNANADQVVVNVTPGMLLLFPAYLPHSVSANESEQPRVSVSFNLMFADFSARMSAPQWSGTNTS